MASKNRTRLLSSLCGSPVDGMVEMRVSGGAADGRATAIVTGAGSSVDGSSAVALGGKISLNASGSSVGTALGSAGGATEACGVAATDAPANSIVGVLVETVPGVATGSAAVVACALGVLRGGEEVL